MSDLAERIRRKDSTLWKPGNVSANRLGWLDLPTGFVDQAADLHSWANNLDAETVVLLGMGGSSLGPAVLSAVAEATGRHNGRKLVVCDTTHPTTVEQAPFEGSMVLVSSKSGTTLEPNALLAYALSRQPDPSAYVAITDPGTTLDSLAHDRGFSRVLTNPSDIGGRYSVLSYFGLAAAALVGFDPSELLASAAEVDWEQAVALGSAMGEAALSGTDKVTILAEGPWASFGLWVEQLIAESTGKDGKGCVPVPTSRPEVGPDRFTASLEMTDASQIGGEFFRWELATAAAGAALGVDPFDEPNVAESKANTKAMLDNLPLPSEQAASATELEGWLQRNAAPGNYVSLQAYFPFGHDAELEAARRRIGDRLGGMAVTAGYGPRFLHSTGQLHKGGPNSVLAVQVVCSADRPDLEIPGSDYGFGTLIDAQALGDLQSLRRHGRKVLRIEADSLEEILP